MRILHANQIAAKDAIRSGKPYSSNIAIEVTLPGEVMLWWGTATFVLDYINRRGALETYGNGFGFNIKNHTS